MAVKKQKESEDTSSSEIISPKSTKDQILSAYQETLKKLEEKQVNTPQEEKKKTDEGVLVTKASQNSIDLIISNLANLKLMTTKQIDVLGENLASEFRKLTDLQEAVRIEQKHLQDLYGIKDSAHTLSALILAQQDQKSKFENDIATQNNIFEEDLQDRKELWKKDHSALEQEYQERKSFLEKNHKREEEEYKYNLDLSRRKDLDDYQSKKVALERELENKRQELIEREKILSTKEQEFKELKQKVEQFSEEMVAMKETAIQETTEKLKTQFTFETQLKEKEIQGETNLYQERIHSLESKIKEQGTLIAQLTVKSDSAMNQVQAIACRALDTSVQRIVSSFSMDEKSVDKQKS